MKKIIWKGQIWKWLLIFETTQFFAVYSKLPYFARNLKFVYKEEINQ